MSRVDTPTRTAVAGAGRQGLARVTLPIEGMTCASCANRIGKGLGRLPGVAEADVNLATERASVVFDPEQVDVDRLVGTVRSLGYEVPEAHTRLAVEGIVCSSCVGRIEQGLRELAGVRGASVNLATGVADVTYLPGAVDVGEMVRAVRDVGYGGAGAAMALSSVSVTSNSTLLKRFDPMRRFTGSAAR